MENRRNDYRHVFGTDDCLPVELVVPGCRAALTGDILDLSLGGLSVRLHQSSPVRLSLNQRVTVRFRVPDNPAEFAFHGHFVHFGTDDDLRYGIQFLRPVNPLVAEAREKALWLYLLDEQRNLRRGAS